MDAELKAKWTAALRSGEYQQCQGALTNSAGGFCCLGVLAKITGNDISLRDERYDILDKMIGEEDNRGPRKTLVRMNDGVPEDDGSRKGIKPFTEIADWIDANL